MVDTMKFDSVHRWKRADVCGRWNNLNAGGRLMLTSRDATVMRKACFRSGDMRHLVRDCLHPRNCYRSKKQFVVRNQEPVLMISKANVVRFGSNKSRVSRCRLFCIDDKESTNSS